MQYITVFHILPPWLGVALMAVAAVCVAWTLVFGCRRLHLTGSRIPCGESEYETEVESADDTDGRAESEGAQSDGRPLLSVVVYVHDDTCVAVMLDSLASQTFTDYEVIVVNDAPREQTDALAERNAWRDGVRFTFVPAGSRNVSRLKLAYTLGIKAARGEYVLTTTANCLVPSDRWLEEMTAPLAEDPSLAVVLGYARPDLSEAGASRRWCAFDTVMTSAQWIGSALGGHPYRGDRHNLLFRRELFFAHEGYRDTNHLETGDDDLFIASIADGDNTRVVVSPSTMLTEKWQDSPSRVWRDVRDHYRFTSKWLPRGPFRITAWLGAMQWLVPLLALLAWVPFALGCGHWWPGAVAAGLTVVLWSFETVLYRRAARALGSEALCWSVVPFMLWRPLYYLFTSSGVSRGGGKKYFTNRV